MGQKVRIFESEIRNATKAAKLSHSRTPLVDRVGPAGGLRRRRPLPSSSSVGGSRLGTETPVRCHSVLDFAEAMCAGAVRSDQKRSPAARHPHHRRASLNSQMGALLANGPLSQTRLADVSEPSSSSGSNRRGSVDTLRNRHFANDHLNAFFNAAVDAAVDAATVLSAFVICLSHFDGSVGYPTAAFESGFRVSRIIEVAASS
jgi:hypothetical protein